MSRTPLQAGTTAMSQAQTDAQTDPQHHSLAQQRHLDGAGVPSLSTTTGAITAAK